MLDTAEIERRASRIKLLLMDCDGVLTDGRIWLVGEDGEQKCFNTHDGQGLSMLHRAGLRSGIISGRKSSVVDRRARELGVEFVKQGDVHKVKAFEAILAEASLDEGEVAFIGDDVPDIAIMRRVELAVTVADAVAECHAAAHYVTRAPGGRGAVREVVELILKSQGRWADLVDEYVK
jgi:3-deoxy-D-manno-octulosonate 8-phosphate phosphatase (KDO 8-P phosphatase)